MISRTKTPEYVRRERQRLTSLEPKRLRKVISDEVVRAARMEKAMKGRISWAAIAKRFEVPKDELIRRCDRVLARKMGLRAPGWLYGYKQPRKRKPRK